MARLLEVGHSNPSAKWRVKADRVYRVKGLTPIGIITTWMPSSASSSLSAG